MKKSFIPLLVVGTALIAAGCDQKPGATAGGGTAPATTPSAASAPAINKADAVAVVNGKYISKATFENMQKAIAERMQGQPFPKEKLLEEMIQRELLVQDAEQKHLENTPEVMTRMEDVKKDILTQAEIQNFMKAHPVTDEEIKAEYDSKIGGLNNKEYKARHILVKTEDEAKKLIAELDKGADFAKLANKNSLDGKEAQNGGDLGWFTPGQMVEPFSKAVTTLEKGKYTKTPVQTQFGWHVILLEDSRSQTPPPLESVKEQLMPMLQRKKVQDMLESLRKQAKVEVFVSLKDEPPKPPVAGQPVTEEVVVEEGDIKDKNGKVVAKETAIEEDFKDKDGKTVAKEVAVEEDIKDKDGKTVAKEVVIEEVVEGDKTAEEKKPDAKAKPATEKKK